jgi:hypothetical protein
MNKSAVKYAAEFQWVVALTDWDDDTLVLQYYWELNEDYQRWDSQNELIWRASEYDQYLHQHWQLSMKMMNEAYRHYTSKMWKDIIFSEEVTLWILTQLRSTVSSNHKWSKNDAWASFISLNSDEQRLANVITVKSSDILQEPAKTSTKEKRSCSNKYMHSAWRSELNSLLWQYVLNTYEQQRQSWMIFTETQERTKQL